MGRAEKRMAKKRAAKGQQYQGGRPLSISQREDVLPKSVVMKRLREVPVFRVLERVDGRMQPASDAEGRTLLYMDDREARQACAKLPGSKVVGLPLDEVYFDNNALLKPADSAMLELKTVPSSRALVPDVKVPLFCIDGFQTTAKDTGVSSLPLFFSKAELLEFAKPVYGSSAAVEKVRAPTELTLDRCRDTAAA